MFERLIPLIGEENLNKIKNTKILLVGIDGVGGFTLECLVRSGFENITIIDGDTIDESNLNRQLITNKENINHFKVDEALNRYNKINSSLNLKGIKAFLTKENFQNYIKDDYDYIIDALPKIGMFLRVTYRKSDDKVKEDINNWIQELEKENYYDNFYLEDVIFSINNGR